MIKSKVKLSVVFLGLIFILMFINNNKILQVSSYYIIPTISLVLFFLQLLNTRTFKLNIYSAFMLFFVISTIISAIMTTNNFSTGILFSYLLLGLLFGVVSMYKMSYVEELYIIASVLTGNIIISLLILIFRVDYYGGGGVRLTIKVLSNTIIDPNYLGAYLALGCFAACYILVNIKRNAVIIGMSIIVLSGTLLTGSRGAMLSLVIVVASSVIQILINHKKIKNTKDAVKVIFILICIIIGLVLITKALPQQISERLFVDSYNDGSNARRLVLWKNALNAISQRWLTGYGCVEDHVAIGMGAGIYQPAHNTFLSFWLQLGLLGIGSILLIIIYMIYKAIKLHRVDIAGLILATCMSSIMIGATCSFSFWGGLIISMLLIKSKEQNHE